MCELQREILRDGIPLAAFLSDHTGIFSSRGEVRRMLKDNGIMINKQRPQEESVIGLESLLNDRYILVQKGKKNYYLVKVV